LHYFGIGEVDAAGLSLRSVFRPAGFCGVVVLRGEEPGFGEPVGEGVGLVDGLADGATVGLATGGLFGAVFAGGSQALNMATLAARIVDNINDLLIVFLLKIETRGRNAVRSTDITAGLMRCVFLRTASKTLAVRRFTPTLRAIERVRGEILAEFYSGLAIRRPRNRQTGS